MAEPTVACILLTRDRPEMARLAVEAFRAQTYANKRLLILDTGNESAGYFGGYNWITHHWADASLQSWSIGELRNEAIDTARRGVSSDIIVHMDDDDYSHPNRIAQQVALLEWSGSDAVGYREALFWQTFPHFGSPDGAQREPRAWLYSTPSPAYVIGGSLAYWRKTWEAKPFPDLPKRNAAGEMGTGEDVAWCRGLRVVGVASLDANIGDDAPSMRQCMMPPRFIGRIHGGNTMDYRVEAHPDTWRRAASWDEYCREIFA